MDSHTNRIVVLVDMDCFYCQVEEKLNPSLAGKPIAVVQYNAWRGGGLIAVNYLARDKGVTRHMRGDEAKEKCPDIELVSVPAVRGKADLTKYREGGKRVAEVLQTYTPLLQRASVDEAYLDITEAVENRLQNIERKLNRNDLQNTYVVGQETEDFINYVYKNDFNNEHNLKLLMGGAIVEEIRASVYEKTGYRCSAGIAHNKILAKLACGINKPNKQTLLPHESVEEMYKTLPIKKIKSLGGKFGHSLAEDLKIKFMSELAQFSEKELMKKYDEKTGNWLYNIAKGIDLEPVETRLISKSIGCCKRFPGKNALTTSEDVIHWLSELSEEISERLEQDFAENNRRAKQIVLSFAQEINKKDIHSSRTMYLTSHDAKKITEDTFENLKRHTQKNDGSFMIKFLGLSAGKFENTKNVSDISSFFKNMQKNVEKSEITEDMNKNKTTLAPKAKNNDLTNFLTPKNVCTENILSDKTKNTLSNVEKSVSLSKNGKILPFKSKTNDLTCYFMPKNDNDLNFNVGKSDIHRNNIGKTKIMSKNFNATDDQITIKNDEKSKDMYLNDEKTNDSNEYDINIDISKHEISLQDIENDAILSDSSNCSNFSNTTIEMDATDILNNKIEFPFRETNTESLKKSPILNQNGKSFFLRYLKKFDDPTTSNQVQNELENTKFEEISYEICPECKENIPKTDFIMHLDHHMAVKMMKEEESLFKQVKEQTKIKKSPPKEVTKSKKRKIVENNKNITSFFVPKTNLKDENSEICTECGKNILISDFESHIDFHAAKKLHLELNPVKIVTKNNFKMKKNDKSVNNCLTNFFKPK